ncbi:MAG: DUF2949 domain-containing protein [Crocosphaera sp.]
MLITESFSAVMEHNSIVTKLIKFLREEMGLPQDHLEFVKNKQTQPGDPIPMLLWQYGFISLNQLQMIWDWLDAQVHFQSL